MSQKPCLTILSPGFPESEADSTCLPAVQAFVISAKKMFPELELMVVALQYPFHENEYLWNEIQVISIGGRNRSKVFRLRTWGAAFRILNRIRQKKNLIGVLSLWAGECALIGKIFSNVYNVKHYTWSHGQDARRSNYFPRLMRLKGKELIAISDFNASEFLLNHGVRAALIAQNGISASVFPVLNTGARQIDILGAGSLIALKNYSQFIRIISSVKNEFPDIRAVIAGGGSEEQLLKALVKRLAIEDNVKFTGLVSHAEVLDLMNNCKIFLHPSQYEGNSTVMIEALFSGCQVISKLPLSNDPLDNHCICKSESDMIIAVKNLLKRNNAAGRVTFHVMDDTAKKIISLFTGQR